MRVYVGQTRSAKLIAQLEELGFGECTNRGELPPRRFPWFLDNGAYSDWTNARPFNLVRWTRDLSYVAMRLESGEWSQEMAPDFVVVPDLVADEGSLRYSLDHVELARRIPGVPVYLAVQDGMTLEQVGAELAHFDGVFVGGSLEWKLETGAAWVELAHAHGKPCHIGRVGTPSRLEWAIEIGADSVDSCLPLWSQKKLDRFAAIASREVCCA